MRSCFKAGRNDHKGQLAEGRKSNNKIFALKHIPGCCRGVWQGGQTRSPRVLLVKGFVIQEPPRAELVPL